MKYAWIAQHRDSFPISVMCDVLNVSPSGYYDSLDRPPSARAERHERIQQAVQQAHAESHGIYGSQKVAEVMQQREDLESACRNTVAAAMRELGLKSRVCKRFKPTTTQIWRPRPAGCTWPSWSIFSAARRLAGRSARRWRRNLSAMPCDRRSSVGGPTAGGCCTIRIADASTRATLTRER